MAARGRRPTPPAAFTVASATASGDVRLVRHLRSGLVVRLTEADGRTRAAVHGEIDLDCADLLEDVLTDALRSAPGGVHLDLSGVRFFDCAGLNSLLRVRGLEHPGSAELTVTSVSAAVARVLDLTQTWPAFPRAAADERPPTLPRTVDRARPA